MSKTPLNKKIKRNYVIVTTAMVVFIIIPILYQVMYVSFVEGNAWREIGATQLTTNIKVPAIRGNIYSANHELMATSESMYRTSIDFWADGVKEDTLFKYVGALSEELHKMFPQKSAAEYKSHIIRGWNIRLKEQANKDANGRIIRKTREYRLLNQDVNYLQWKRLQKMPFFEKGPNKSGLQNRKFEKRTKPYGTLASRAIGDIYSDFDMGGKNGLELQYDSLLKGEAGTSTRQRINGRNIETIDVDPINGKDIISTIDINIQDITEKTLLKKLREIDAQSGTAVVMEVQTGEIKAITNMGRVSEGVWTETQNFAVSDMSEPGSTFKVVSMMVALEDGLVHPDDSVDTGNGVAIVAGQHLEDHNANRGGYQMITAAKSIRYSSNIGVAKLILRAYGDDPGKYVDGIYRIGLNKDLHLEIPGYGIARIRHPKDANTYWSRTTLPWMSFGYETQIPPIYTLTFFNSIANDGKMVKPLFVKEIQNNGKTIEKRKTEVVNKSVCSAKTLAAIREMLYDVVNASDGTGKPAHSDRVKISGKTGTAQISRGAAGYRSAGTTHQVSFCGYFPSDKPEYSCIVVIRNPRNGSPSGGLMCGSVFKEIAEEIYARDKVFRKNSFPVDTIHTLTPKVKSGLWKQSQYALNKLDISYIDSLSGNWTTSYLLDNKLILKDRNLKEGLVPNVIGMGAKDAIFALESAGLLVQLSGKGVVVEQSVTSGTKLTKGQSVRLDLK